MIQCKCFAGGKLNSEADINNQLGQMNDFFEPHKFTECTDQVMDYNVKIYKFTEWNITLKRKGFIYWGL